MSCLEDMARIQECEQSEGVLTQVCPSWLELDHIGLIGGNSDIPVFHIRATSCAHLWNVDIRLV